MPDKLDILVTLQYRDKFSVGPNRLRLGRRAFHWSIIIVAGKEYHRFDVTDGIVQDPVTLQDLNPDRVWVYRHNVSNDLLGIPRYLGSIQISQKPLDCPITDIVRILDNVPIPNNNADRSRENCVSWTVDAITALQDFGYCSTFDLGAFQDFATVHADKRLADFKNRTDPIKYQPSVNRWLRLF